MPRKRSIRMLVTGWRHANLFDHGRRVASALTLGHIVHQIRSGAAAGLPPAEWDTDNAPRNVTLVHGACPTGVDRIAATLAAGWGWTVEAHPAIGHPDKDFGNWPAAGPRRNAHMVALGADICVALPGPGSRGTIQCVGMAINARIPVITYPIGTDRP